MAGKTIRTVLAVDGEKRYRQAIQSCNTAIRAMSANVNRLTSDFQLNNNNTKSLKNAQSQLKQEINQLKSKEDILKQAMTATNTTLEKAKQEYTQLCNEGKKNTAESQRLANAITTLERKYNDYKRQLYDTQTAQNQAIMKMRELTQESGQANTGLTAFVRQLSVVAKGLSSIGLAAFKTSIAACTESIKIGAEGLAAYATAVTAVGAAVGKFATSAGADFEEGMSAVESISQATSEEMERLTDKAKQLGSTTKFTATESSQAFNYMAMAGWTAEQMLEGIDGVVNLAAASGEDLATVSDIVTDSLTAFGMSANESNRYANILAKAASSANTNVAMMGETFQYCAPIAGAMGYEVDDLATAIGLMANAGIKGSLAGTSLRSIISNIASPTKNAQAAFDELKIKLENDDGTMKSFEETVNLLRDAFSGLSEAEKAEKAKAIAGKTGMSGLLAIVNSSSESYTELAENIDHCSGAAEEMAKIRLDNFKGDVTLLKSATEGLGLSIYETFSNKLRKGTKFVTIIVNKIHDAIEYGRDFGLVLKDIQANINNFIVNGIKNNISKLPAMLSGFNQVVLGISDLIIALLPEVINTIIPEFVKGFGDLISGLSERLPEFLQMAIDGVVSFLDMIVNGLKLVRTGMTLVHTLIDGIVANLPAILQMGIDVLMQFVWGIIDNLPYLLNTAVDIVLTVIDGILDNLDKLIAAALRLLIVLSEFIVDNLDKILPYIPKIILALVQGLIDNLPLLIEACLEICIAIGVGLVQCATAIIGYIPAIFTEIKNAFLDVDWMSVGIQIMTGIFSGVNNLAEKAKDKLGNAISYLKGAITGESGFDIHSPSKWAKNVVGKNLVLGQIEGMEEESERQKSNMFTAVSNFGRLVSASSADLVPAGATAGSIVVNLNGNITLNNTDSDLDTLITDIEGRIYDRQMGRGA